MAWAGWEDYVPPAGRTAPVKATRAKYGNEPLTVDGVTFPSKREANRYLYLRERLGRKEISDLELQPKFPLHVVRPDGVKVEVGSYRADFRYRCGPHVVVEDAKGITTEPYRMRKRHVEAEYGIEVIEV
jgi:hypothetical protein